MGNPEKSFRFFPFFRNLNGKGAEKAELFFDPFTSYVFELPPSLLPSLEISLVILNYPVTTHWFLYAMLAGGRVSSPVGCPDFKPGEVC